MSPPSYWPFLVYAFCAVAVAAGMLIVSYLLGQRHAERTTLEPYESGLKPTGSARLRLSVKFFLIAILFVIFDLELVYIFAWAVAIHELGWSGYAGLLVFIGILLAALVYEWRMGGLKWGERNRSLERKRGQP